MNKCTDCGAEFDGKFCPECGKKYVPYIPEETERTIISEISPEETAAHNSQSDFADENAVESSQTEFAPESNRELPPSEPEKEAASSSSPNRFCGKCGAMLVGNDRFCSKCGAPRDGAAAREPNLNSSAEIAKQKIKKKLYEMAGENDDVHIKLSDLFTNVFQKHSPRESEKLLCCGTEASTPDISEIKTSWPKPWLYSRIFLVLAVSTMILYLCSNTFSNINSLPGLFTLGAFVVPITCLFFFFEVNAPQNISFFRMLEYFFVGGCASLFVTLILYMIIEPGELDYKGAILTSITEELGKLIIVAVIIAKAKPKYRLNGIVIGAAIGAGFAAFESAGYAFHIFTSNGLSSAISVILNNIDSMFKSETAAYQILDMTIEAFYNSGFDEMMSNIILRAFLAPGGHVIWAAITGYAIMLAQDGEPFSVSVLKKPSFLKLFAIPIVLHAIWDMPIDFLGEVCGVQIILTVISWIVMLVLISAGIKQVSNIANKAKKEAEAQSCGK